MSSAQRHLAGGRLMLATGFVLVCGACGSGAESTPPEAERRVAGQVAATSHPAPTTATNPDVSEHRRPSGRPRSDTLGFGARHDRAGRPRLAGPDAHRWWRVLDRLDRSRAEAFRRARPVLLRQVYARGSTLLRRDRAVLAGYRSQGVRLRRVRLDVTALRVVHREPGAVTVRVVERLAPASAVLPDGERVALPVDAPTRRVLGLVHTVDGWRLAVARRLAG